jgi:hypothetical protein
MFNILIAAIHKQNCIPSEPAERCLTWLAFNTTNHQFLIEHGVVELFLAHLIIQRDSPIGKHYINALYTIAFYNDSVRKKFGKQEVLLALHMVEHLESIVAAQFLLLLVNSPPNREIVSNNNGADIILSFTVKKKIFVGLQILNILSIDDVTIYSKAVVELAHWLVEVLNGPPNENQTSILHWIKVCLISIPFLVLKIKLNSF